MTTVRDWLSDRKDALKEIWTADFMLEDSEVFPAFCVSMIYIYTAVCDVPTWRKVCRESTEMCLEYCADPSIGEPDWSDRCFLIRDKEQSLSAYDKAQVCIRRSAAVIDFLALSPTQRYRRLELLEPYLVKKEEKVVRQFLRDEKEPSKLKLQVTRCDRLEEVEFTRVPTMPPSVYDLDLATIEDATDKSEVLVWIAGYFIDVDKFSASEKVKAIHRKLMHQIPLRTWLIMVAIRYNHFIWLIRAESGWKTGYMVAMMPWMAYTPWPTLTRLVLTVPKRDPGFVLCWSSALVEELRMLEGLYGHVGMSSYYTLVNEMGIHLERDASDFSEFARY